MKIYFAASEAFANPGFAQFAHLIQYPLISYQYITGVMKRLPKSWDLQRIFLDSGAFTALTKGVVINHDQYIAFIKEHGFVTYSALDVIGNAKKTKENFLYEKKNGLNPIPAFHYGEPFDYLRYYLDNTDYIALGGVARIAAHKNKVSHWLDKCFSIISDYKAKIHGFALTNYMMLNRFPFYSVDSTSWRSCTIYGTIPKQYFNGFVKLRKLKPDNLPQQSIFLVRNSTERIRHSINTQLDMQEYFTDLWTKRGVTWN